MKEKLESYSRGKIWPGLPAISSAIVWGSGQVINKQYLKGVFFFIIQVLIASTELATGNYFEGSFVFREDAGFFVKGVWGFITLGTQSRVLTLAGVTEGDHSIILLIRGIIVALLLAMILCIYIYNIKDAYKTRKQLNLTGIKLTSLEYIKELWVKMFHYIVMIPAIFLLAFLCIMPILFSILVAFTNYTKTNMPPTNLVDWVGIVNFTNLFKIPIWSSTFFGVLGWTIIWAIASTFSCFFFGLFQAVIVNCKFVKAKKMWRGIYILPWAIPSMISLLVFRTMFNGQFGPVSQLLVDLGITSTRVSWFTNPNNPNLAL